MSEARILITDNGPYIVYGAVPLTVESIHEGEDGGSDAWEMVTTLSEDAPKMALCRCGQSENAPYCDGTHAQIGFDGTMTAGPNSFSENLTAIEGKEVILEDSQPFCAFARFCDSGLNAWDGAESATSGEQIEHLKRQVAGCASGRLILRMKSSNEVIEPKLPKKIAVTQDPSRGCSGPLWVTGGLEIETESGEKFEVRNRVTLCRCGVSKNKPFCDGSHIDAGYQDGLKL